MKDFIFRKLGRSQSELVLRTVLIYYLECRGGQRGVDIFVEAEIIVGRLCAGDGWSPVRPLEVVRQLRQEARVPR